MGVESLGGGGGLGMGRTGQAQEVNGGWGKEDVCSTFNNKDILKLHKF